MHGIAKLKQFLQNRQRFFAQMIPNSIAIFYGATNIIRNNDIHYPFRQNSDFYYLSGITEAEAIIVLINGSQKQEFLVLSNPTDLSAEQRTGFRLGEDKIKNIYGADKWFSIATVKDELPKLIQNTARLYYLFSDTRARQEILDCLKIATDKVNIIRTQRLSETMVTAPQEIEDAGRILHELRMFKNAVEIEKLQYAAEISAKAHIKLMQTCSPGIKEYQLSSLFTYSTEIHGCRGLAYQNIIASGKNSCVLHYYDNNDTLRDGDLLLVDAGAECDYYAADITRTYPVNGKFSAEQKIVYNIVLTAQKAGIAAIKPQTPWLEVMRVIDTEICKGLVDVGILTGEIETLVKERKFADFYMHPWGHWLGLDVHDVGKYRVNDVDRLRKLMPGMVTTVEPGLYFRRGLNIDPKWIDIGVRIEDDVLVTETGNIVLSAGVPKEIDEIESIMASPKTMLPGYEPKRFKLAG